LVDYGRKHNFAVLATKIVCQSIRLGQVRTMVAGRVIWHGTKVACALQRVAAKSNLPSFAHLADPAGSDL
jgi:hypothetical protein